MNEPALPEKILAVHRRLAEAKIAHAFGGALALAYYAEPRATVDIDINIFVAPAEHRAVSATLAPLGVGEIDAAVLERDGQYRTWWGRTPIDLFFAYDEIHGAMRRDLRMESFGEGRIPVLSPEHLVVCKASFDRPKDWLDIEQVLVCVADLDIPEIRRWLDRIVGPRDRRRLRFEELVEALLSA
jgi:hypothetical protein